MGLSYDVISEFAKIANGDKEKPKEGIVYATIVQASDGKYVKIDGSDLLTPTDTTTDIEDGERVTVMIKDHRATVTGNVSAPSASGNRVDKVVEVVSEQLGVFETVVADKVSTNELEAYKATIENLVAGKAEIEDLKATNAEIENLKVKNAEIENLVADKATIEDLEVVNAVIENLKVKDAEIENLVADKATINDLNAVNADIQNLKVKHAQIEDLVADKADIEDLEATNAEIENLKATDARIENLVADKATISDLEATKAEIEVLDADFAEIKTLVNGNLTSDNILSFNITADKVTMEDAFIKDAMIDTVNASKINAGRINTNSVVIGSEDGGMRISGATQQFTDKNGNVRIQIGRDSSNDFTFALYGEDGQGQIINQNGITASAIADGLIVNDMVSDNAAISGGKLDISSVVTEINNDNTTTIKSNKIYLDEQNQSLEVAFKSLKTQVDTIKDIDSDLTTITDKIQSNTSKIEANKSSISTLLAEDAAIKKQVTDLEGNVVETTNTLTSKYTSLQQNLDGFKTTVNNTYATKTSVSDVKNNLSSNYSTTSAMNSAIKQKVDEISASISSTYATKNEVKTVDDNIKTNYSTTKQMESAISVAKNEINLGISQVYETKTEVTNKIGDAVNNLQIGGTNLMPNTGYTQNTNGWGVWNNAHSMKIVDGRLPGKKALQLTLANQSGSGYSTPVISCESNTQYTLSFWIKSSIDCEFADLIKLRTSTGSESNPITMSFIDVPANVWVYYTFTFRTNSSATTMYTTPRINNPVGTPTVQLTEYKLEKGSKATTWSPAPDEIKLDIDSAKTNAISESNKYTDSQIKITKDTIDLSVKNIEEEVSSINTNINNIQVGGTNLLKNSGFTNGTADWSTYSTSSCSRITETSSFTGYAVTFNSTGGGIYQRHDTPYIKGEELMISGYYKCSSTASIRIALEGATTHTLRPTTANTWTKFSVKVVGNGTASTFIFYGENGNTYHLKDLKVEKGNKATDWTPAPYDITKNIDIAKNEAVSSANSTLNTTIANYYTKTQTDSQIKVAKDAIDLSVKNTYETKTNVQNKIDGIKVGSRNLVSQSKLLTTAVKGGSWVLTGTGNEDFKKLEIVTTDTAWHECQIPLNAEINSLTSEITISFEYYESTAGLLVFNFGVYSGGSRLKEISNWVVSSSFKVLATEPWKRVSLTFDPTSVNGVATATNYRIQFKKQTGKTGTIYVRKPKLEIGTVATDWTPAPEDVDNTISSLSTRVSTAEQKITSDAIVSTVTSSTTYKNNLTGKVDKTTIISSINQTAESVKINASKIELTGSVVVSAINSGSTLINGSKIQTGTLSANVITSGTFQGTNFIAGGSSNGNGYFQVKDSSNNVKFHASKNGVYATTINFPTSISSDGGAIINSGTVYANSTGFIADGQVMGTLYRTEYSSKVGLTGITTTEQNYDISNGGNVAGTKYTTTVTGYGVNINGSSLRHAGSGTLQVRTSYGYINMGPANSDWCHINTDRAKFWFEKPVYVNGEIYAGSGYNERVYHQGYKPTPADIGAAKALVSSGGYQGLTLNDGSTSNWIRTTTSGLIPSASSGSSWPSSSSSLGTSSWRFSKGYVKEMYVNGLTNDLGDIWLTAEAGANTIYAQAKWLCPATSATTYLGSSGYRWHSVWAANGTIQTSDERFKIKQGFVNIDDCFEMIKNTDIYNYIMLNENKEKLSKNRLGKMAMENSRNDVNTHIGIMAQDIQKYECSKGILIESEYEKEDGTVDTLLGVNAYGLATAVMGGLKKEIQIRDEQYECLKRENEELKTRLANIERMLM